MNKIKLDTTMIDHFESILQEIEDFHERTKNIEKISTIARKEKEKNV